MVQGGIIVPAAPTPPSNIIVPAALPSDLQRYSRSTETGKRLAVAGIRPPDIVRDPDRRKQRAVTRERDAVPDADETPPLPRKLGTHAITGEQFRQIVGGESGLDVGEYDPDL